MFSLSSWEVVCAFWKFDARVCRTGIDIGFDLFAAVTGCDVLVKTTLVDSTASAPTDFGWVCDFERPFGLFLEAAFAGFCWMGFLIWVSVAVIWFAIGLPAARNSSSAVGCNEGDLFNVCLGRNGLGVTWGEDRPPVAKLLNHLSASSSYSLPPISFVKSRYCGAQNSYRGSTTCVPGVADPLRGSGRSDIGNWNWVRVLVSQEALY
mmetsp:Transcript_1739/g.2998  ORF Transcript_1739/g.2998 Transcript_1739/m.2998 type:complete len:207 (-) Transcript_1739:347-967(-)